MEIMNGFFLDEKPCEEGVMDSQVREIIRTLYEKYATMMYYISLRIVKDAYLAEDVVQSTFLELCKKGTDLHILKNENENEIKNYLARSAINRSLNVCRQQKNEYRYLEYDSNVVSDISGEYTVEMSVENAINCKKIVDTIEDLPNIYHDVLIEHTILGKTCSVIASTRGLNTETVRKRIYRARNLLREKLAREES